MRRTTLLFLAALLGACTGLISDPGASGEGTGGSGGPGGGGPGGRPPEALEDPLAHPAGLGASGIQRLSRAEYRATLFDLLGYDIGADAELLPDDTNTPFDNDYTQQLPSAALIEGLRLVADRTTDAVMRDTALRDAVIGCTPSGPSDEACLRSFVERFGRRALRRPLTAEEADRYVALSSFSVAENDFYVGASLVLRAMLQDMELAYRVEIGTPVDGQPGVFRLTDWELASRLSYFLTGTPPDDTLLDRAAAGELADAAQIRAAAEELLATDAGADRIARFHALWLGYERLPFSPSLADAMRTETDALIERVVLEERGSWLDVFRMTETFVNDELATHYGLPSPGASAGWVPYGTSGRQGLLSHGTFLSNGAKAGDTSPVLRGIAVRERLFCQDIPDPPPTVNTDEPPPPTESGSNCKTDRYSMHSTGGCASCHQLIDPIGFGLEQFDHMGQFRTVEADNPECEITGDGEIAGVGTFNGPAGLADLLIESGELDGCAVEQLYSYAMGRQLDAEDAQALGALVEEFRGRDHSLADLLLDFVSSVPFRHRFIPEEM